MNKNADEYRELLETTNKNLKRCKRLSKVLLFCAIADLIIMLYQLNTPNNKVLYMILSLCFAIFMICFSIMERARIELMLKKDSFQRHIFDSELKKHLFNINPQSEKEREKALESYASRLISKVFNKEDFTTMGKEDSSTQKKNKVKEEKK